VRVFFLCSIAATLACPAFGQPGTFDVPESIWPDDLQWRSLGESSRMASTRFGEVSVAQTGGGEGSPRSTVVRLDTASAQPNFAGDSSIVLIRDVLPLGERDIVVFVAVQGGSGSPPGTLNLLPISSDGIGQMIADPELRSIDGFQRIAVARNEIFFDLGFHDGLRRSARLGSDGLEILEFEVQVNGLSNEDCWHLYSAVGSATCVLSQPYSMATQRWMSSLDHHPAFEKESFFEMCAAAGENRAPPIFEDFRGQVCSGPR